MRDLGTSKQSKRRENWRQEGLGGWGGRGWGISLGELLLAVDKSEGDKGALREIMADAFKYHRPLRSKWFPCHLMAA